LNIGTNDEILTPAYNCGAEIDPFINVGAKVIYYRINNKAKIDILDIKERVSPFTKIIYVSHFFGWPQDIVELAEWCRTRNIFLVEDCALCLFSQGPDETIGRIGDAAIYSFVKTLPMPDGGALVLKDSVIPRELMPSKKPPMWNTVRNSLPLLKKWFMNSNTTWQRYGFAKRLLTKSWLKDPARQDDRIDREMPQGNYFDAGKIGWRMSRLSRGILSQSDPRKIVETRRRNYQRLHEALCDLRGIELLFDGLPSKVCPHSFPFFVDDRTYWSRALEERGINVGGWPSYHRGFDWKDFPEAKHLKNDLVTVPVHQDLDSRHMDHIAKCIKSIAEDHAHRHG
jgi:dTDP-4-amino-4,6-dideoxygalactose transaminase